MTASYSNAVSGNPDLQAEQLYMCGDGCFEVTCKFSACFLLGKSTVES